MNILTQIVYTVKRILMNFQAVFIKLFAFILIILILGSAFQDIFVEESSPYVDIVLVNQDKGEYGKDFLSNLKDVDEIKKFVTFTEEEKLDDAVELVRGEKVGAVFVVPEDFSDKIEKHEQKIVSVYWKKGADIDAVIIQNVIDTYLNALNTANIVLDIQKSLDGYSFDNSGGLEEIPMSKNKNSSAMAYYAVAMLLMLILYGMEYGSEGMAEDYLEVVGCRLKLSPIRTYQQYIGKMIGLTLVTFFQAIVIVLFTSIVYKVTWTKNIGMLLIIIFLFAAVATTLGAMLCLLFQDKNKASSIANVLVILFTFITGGYVPMDFGKLERISPSYYAKTALYNLMYDGTTASTLQCIYTMCGMIVLFTVLSILLARRKRA